MSECVVRMEMPKNCFECPFSIIDDTADGAWCNALAQQVYCTSDGRDNDCPIVCSLPEGHGRLVDGDDLLDDMKVRKCFFGRRSDPNCLVEDAKTIVPADTAERSDHEAD